MNADHLRRWGALCGAAALVAAGILTRSACAPLPPLSAPAASAAETRSNEGREPGAGSHAPAAATHAAAAAALPERGPPELASPAPAGAVDEASSSAVAPAVPDAAARGQAASTPAGSAVPVVDKRELALLASIERDLKRAAPPEVHALLGEYRRGADRATLLARVQHELPKDLRLRVTVLRWIDEVRPDPDRPVQANAVPGQGRGASWVRPLERR